MPRAVLSLLVASVLAAAVLAPVRESRGQIYEPSGPNGRYMYVLGGGSPPTVRVYDMDSLAWRDPLALPAPARCIAAEDDVLYFATGQGIFVQSVGGSAAVQLSPALISCERALVSGDLLVLIDSSSRVTALDKHTGELRTSILLAPPLLGVVASPLGGSLLGLQWTDSHWYVGSARVSVQLQSRSTVGGESAILSRVWVVPSTNEVVAGTGLVQDATTLAYRRSLGAIPWSFASDGERTVFSPNAQTYVLEDPRGAWLGRAFTNVWFRTLHIHAGKLFQFDSLGAADEPAILALDDLPRDVLRAPSVPTDTTYRAVDVEVGGDGIVYMLDDERSEVIRYSLAQRRHLATIPFPPGAQRLALWSEQGRLVVAAGSNGQLWQAAMGSGDARAQPLATIPDAARVLVGTESLLLAGGKLFGELAVTALDPDGVALSHGIRPELDNGEWWSEALAWSRSLGRLFVLRLSAPEAAAYVELDDAGVPGPLQVSPEARNGGAYGRQLWLSPDERFVATDAGALLHADTLTSAGSLPPYLLGAAWAAGSLFTISRTPSYPDVFSLDERGLDGAVRRSFPIGETLLALRSWGERIVLVTRRHESGAERVAFRVLAAGSSDLDADGVADAADVFPVDALTGADRDHDGVEDARDDFPRDPTRWLDSDGDGHADFEDALPWDARDWVDRDGDLVGDNTDVFPDDPTEQADTDGDGVGDHADALPLDRRDWVDRDHDGLGDNTDVFPDDPAEQYDFDADGAGDHGDAFPDVAFEQSDADGDGTGDRDDAFPLDAAEWRDTDEDGIGNLADPTPFGVVDGEGVVVVKATLKLRRFYPAHARGALLFTRFGGDRFALCFADVADCLTGHVRSSKNGRKLALDLDELSWRYFARDLDSTLTRAIGSGPLSITVEPTRRKAKLVVSIAKDGHSAKLSVRIPHRARAEAYGNIDGYTSYTGAGSYAAP